MAKATGFMKRKRKFSAFEFVLVMTVGQMAMVHPVLVRHGGCNPGQNKQGCFAFAVHSPSRRVPSGVPENGS